MKRIDIAILFGLVAGALCAGGATVVFKAPAVVRTH